MRSLLKQSPHVGSRLVAQDEPPMMSAGSWCFSPEIAVPAGKKPLRAAAGTHRRACCQDQRRSGERHYSLKARPAVLWQTLDRCLRRPGGDSLCRSTGVPKASSIPLPDMIASNAPHLQPIARSLL